MKEIFFDPSIIERFFGGKEEGIFDAEEFNKIEELKIKKHKLLEEVFVFAKKNLSKQQYHLFFEIYVNSKQIADIVREDNRRKAINKQGQVHRSVYYNQFYRIRGKFKKHFIFSILSDLIKEDESLLNKIKLLASEYEFKIFEKIFIEKMSIDKLLKHDNKLRLQEEEKKTSIKIYYGAIENILKKLGGE